MFLSREIDIKLCQNYTKTNIYQISYKKCNIKQTLFNNYATNLKTTISHRSLRISDMYNMICTIDNTITYSLSSPYTSPERPPIAVQYCCHMYHVTSILHCYRPKFWWRNTDYTDFWYNFDTVLYQFLETGTSDRCLICIVQNLKFSGFNLYPLSFFLYSPFNKFKNLARCYKSVTAYP